MDNSVVPVSLKGVMPTSNGCALFLGTEEKTFIIYVDQAIGNTISMIINEVTRERPMTHEFIGHIFVGFGIKLDRVIINDVDDGTFFARVILRMENEIEKKLVEIDARPSDAMAIALHQKRPILAHRKVLAKVEDVTHLLERILDEQKGGE
jgi:hypothetical protein